MSRPGPKAQTFRARAVEIAAAISDAESEADLERAIYRFQRLVTEAAERRVSRRAALSLEAGK